MKMKEKLSKMFKNGFLLGMSVMMVVGLMQIQRAYASEENKTVDLIDVAEANKGAFTKLELSAKNPVDRDNKFELEVELAIDNDYLDEKISDLLESGTCGLGTETVDIDCLNELEDDELDPIMVNFTIDGSNIAVEGEQKEIALKTADNTRIGQYSLNDDSELISCTVIFDKAIYSYMAVTAGFSFGLNSTVDNTDTQMPQLSLGNEGNTIVVTIDQNPAIPPDSVIDYELKKTGKELTDTVGIEYVIKATAEKNESAPNSAKAMLNGKTLIEEIPDGLMLEEIKRGDTKLTEAESKDFLNGSNYLIEGNQLIYKFAEYSEEEESISDTTFTVKYALNETGYMNFMKNGIDKKFKNTAKLFGDISLPPLAISNMTETPLKMVFMNKDGHAKSLGSKTYDWEIVVNSAFSSGEGVFIVDEIDSSNQIFNKDSLKINEALVYVTENKKLDITYDDLTATALSGITEAFIYNAGDKQILVIPIAQEYLGKKFTISYSTVVQGFDNPTDQGSKDLINRAKPLWKSLQYGGIGPGFDDSSFNISLEKKVVANFRLAYKEAGNYNEATQEMIWKLKINEFLGSFDEFVISDTLNDTEQRFPEAILDGTESIILTKKALNSESDDSTITINIKGETLVDNYYTIEKTNDKTTLSLHLKMTASDYYEGDLKTIVVDPNLLSKQEKGEIDNTLSIKATTDLVVTEKESTAKKTVNNTWVKKEAIATYDYSENSLKWKITANPNHLPISELVIEDLLPVGLELPKEIKIKSIPKSGDVTETTINPKIKTEDEFTYTETNGQEGIYPKNSFSLSKGAETTDTIEIEFSTEVNASFRKEQFKNDIKVKFENNINLTGLYADKEAFKVNASANAVHNPLIDPLTKSGIYQNNEYEIDGVKVKIPHITWQIVLNRAQVDMSGWTLVDRLKPFLELDPFSVKLYEVELNADGTMILENKSEVANGLFIMDSGGFSFNVPESLKGKVLMIEFVTLVTDTASAKEMSNQAILVMDEENSTSTKEVIASGAQDFNFEDFATASTVPVVKVWKISENSELDKDDKPLYPIYGAEFQLTPLELKDGDWKPSEGSIKAKTTTQTGAATFMFLKKNQLYEIREIEAPNGYELNEDPKYIVFNPEEEQAFPKGTVEKNDKELFHTFMIKNQPVDASTIEFYVRMSDGTPISGIEYEIKSKNTKARKATSDMNGKVIFANVDQDEYTITLVKGLGFDLSETIKAKVDEKGIIITNGTIIINDKDVVVASADFYGTVTVNKTNNNTEPLSSAEFIVYTMQNVAVASLKESGVSGTYQLSNEKDDETLYNVNNIEKKPYLKEEQSEFQLLGGNYYIWESVAPLGYKVDKIKHPIFITETNNMIELTISNQKVIEPINPDDSGSAGGGSPSKPKPVYPDIEEIFPDLPIEEIQHPTNPMDPVGETSSSSNAGTNTYDTPNTGILLPSDITLFILMVVSLGGIFLVLRGKKPTHKS